MLTCESVRSTDSPHFAMLDALYARAFPWHEQRESEAKRQALSHPRYALEAWFDEGSLPATVISNIWPSTTRCAPAAMVNSCWRRS
mgnify:CR=1 FL=1